MKRIPPSCLTFVDYSKWSQEQLIERIISLEGRKPPKKIKQQRPFDFSLYPTQHIALRIAYLGWDYNGFASQMSYRPLNDADDAQDTIKDLKPFQLVNIERPVVTVEDVLFQALLRTRLIESPRTCNYSRCGRTDAGVSSVGQVIALTVRSSAKKLGEAPNDFDIPICTMLNRSLPPEIRVLGWSPIPVTFNARFSCIGRRYRYFFSSHGLDLAKMQEAASKLVGEHDFRNFCRKDAAKKVTNFVRRLFKAEISPVSTSGDNNDGMYQFEIHGTAFLYNQVRCTMQLLYLIGRGLEPVEVIDYLLDLERCPVVPQYDLASEIPLVLYQCYYPDSIGLNFTVDESEEARMDSEWHTMWRQLRAKSLTLDLLRQGHDRRVNPFWGIAPTSNIFPK